MPGNRTMALGMLPYDFKEATNTVLDVVTI